MIVPNLLLAFVFFLSAGYYGALRSILLEFSFNWLTIRQDEENQAQKVFYWRRILRMMRFMSVAVGCFCVTLALFNPLDQVLKLGGAAYVFITLLVSVALWTLSYTIWLQTGLRYRRSMALTTFPVRFAEWFVTPLYWTIEPFISLKSVEKNLNYNRDDRSSVDDDEPEENSKEEQLFINALDFKDVRIRDCMIPRTEISAVSIRDSVEDLRQEFIHSGHSKIVVYDETLDEPLGYCHSLALFKKPKDIASMLTSILIVPESMPANGLMLRFLEERKSLALVVDEFGGTSGLVSVEDIVEQIFGEIQDEYDVTEDWVERQISDNTFLISARNEIDYLNEKYDWELPEGDYDTLAGLIIHLHEDIPKVEEVIELPPFLFKIVSMDDNRLELVEVTIVSDN